MTLIAASLLGYMVFIIGEFSFGERGYAFTISFYSVDGLSNGSNVSMSGVRIGKVTNIEISDDQVLVGVYIRDKNIRVRRNSTFTITTAGLMGEKYVEIMPTRDFTSPYVSPNDTVAGTDPTRMDEIFEQGNILLQKLQELTDSARDIIDDPELKDNTRMLFRNARIASDRISEVALIVRNRTDEIIDGLESILSRIDQQLESNQQDIRDMIKNFKKFSLDLSDITKENRHELKQIVANITSTTKRLDHIMSELQKNNQLTDDLKATIESVRDASDNAKIITDEVREIIADKEIRKKISTGLDDAHRLAQAVDKVFLNIRQTRIDFKYLLRYHRKAEEFISDLNVDLYPSEKTFYRLGVEDVGGEDLFTLMAARDADTSLVKRGGIISSKVGLGIDYFMSNELGLSVDLVDVPDSEVRFKAGYRMNENVRFELRIDDLTDKKDVNFGFEYKF